MGSGEGALVFEIINRGASAHFAGGIPIGDSSNSGAVDPYLRVFGQPGAAAAHGARRRPGRAAARREEVRRHPRIPLLSSATELARRTRSKPMTELTADAF